MIGAAFVLLLVGFGVGVADGLDALEDAAVPELEGLTTRPCVCGAEEAAGAAGADDAGAAGMFGLDALEDENQPEDAAGFVSGTGGMLWLPLAAAGVLLGTEGIGGML